MKTSYGAIVTGSAADTARNYLAMRLIGHEGFLDVVIRHDPRTYKNYLVVFVTELTEEIFDDMPDYLYGHTVVVEQVGGGRRLA